VGKERKKCLLGLIVTAILLGSFPIDPGCQAEAATKHLEDASEIRVEDRRDFTRVVFRCSGPEACSVEPDLERHRFIVLLPGTTPKIVPSRLPAEHPLVHRIETFDDPEKGRGVEVVLKSLSIDWVSYRYDDPPRTVLYLKARRGIRQTASTPSKPPISKKTAPPRAGKTPPAAKASTEPKSEARKSSNVSEIPEMKRTEKIEEALWRPSATDIPEFLRVDPVYPPDFQEMRADERDLYQKALKRYREQDFSGAKAIVSKIIPREPRSSLAEILAFFKADCQFRRAADRGGQDYLRAIQTYQEAVIRFPRSAFVAHARLTVGLGYRRIGFFQEALLQYQMFLKEFPESPAALEAEFWEGECLFQHGKYEEAKRLFETFARESPQSIHGRIAALRVGDCLYKLGDVKGARKQYGAVLADISDLSCVPVDSLELAGLSFLRNGDFQKGRGILFRAVNLDPHSKQAGDMMNAIARSYLEEHREDEALKVNLLLCEGLGQEDAAAAGWVRLADMRLSRPWLKWPPLCLDACLNPIGVYQRFLDECQDMDAADHIMYRKSLAQVKDGQLEEAVVNLKKIVSQRQQDPLREQSASLLAYCLNSLIRQHHNHRDDVDVVHLYTENADFLQGKENPDQGGLILVAESFQQLGLLEDALCVYRLVESSGRGPQDHVLFQTAGVLTQQGDKEGAREALECLHMSFPQSGYVVHAEKLLGDICLDLKDEKAAATWYRRALAKMGTGPDTGPVWVRLGRALRGSGQHREAMAAYRRAISTMWPQRKQIWAKKSLGETLSELAEYCENRGQIPEATEYYTKAVSIAPSDDHVDWALYQLGESHRKMGNLAMMHKVFEDLNKRSPDSLWAKLADWSRGNAAFEGESGPYLAQAQERITRERKE